MKLFTLLTFFGLFSITESFTNIKSTRFNYKLNGQINPQITKANKYLAEESLTELYKDIDNKQIDDIYFSNDLKNIYISKEDDNKDIDTFNDYRIIHSDPALSNNIVQKCTTKDIKAYILKDPTSVVGDTLNGAMGIINGFIIPSFILYFFISTARALFSANSGGNPFNGGNGPNIFNNDKIKDRMIEDKENMVNSNITLSSWAGSPEIFQECTEVVSYLKNATSYKNAGAEIPKGILLEGPPGTGKTLLAKAIASECESNFISIASSEFVEIYVGLGAQKVRNLFKEARENKPCIIFVDEIDSIGKQRGTGINMGNDEREQTLNQLLAEMDGFNQNDGILVIGATNRRDVLDSALLRPGRFDRLINVPLPDKNARKEIFKVHSRNKNIEENIEFDFLSELTGGFSGAQIKNLLNEAAINCARDGKSIISQENIEDALEKLVVGLVKKDDSRSATVRKRVAVHEIGHAFLASFFDKYFDLKKVTIQSTYNGAGGYTLFNEKPEIVDGGLYTKDLLKKRLIVSLGGKAAEVIYYGKDHVSLGAIQDLKQANNLAKSMVGNYGMGEELQVFYNEDTDGGRTPFLGRSLATGDKYSDKTREIFDRESLNLVKTAYDDALYILSKNKEKLNILVKLLIDNETLKDDIFKNNLPENRDYITEVNDDYM